MTHIKALIAATAISTGFALALPAVSEAMPAGPVNIQATSDSNVVNVHYKSKKWARYCRYHNNWRCHHYRYTYRYRYYDPYVYDPYPYYGYYPRRYYGPGIGLRFRID